MSRNSYNQMYMTYMTPLQYNFSELVTKLDNFNYNNNKIIQTMIIDGKNLNSPIVRDRKSLPEMSAKFPASPMRHLQHVKPVRKASNMFGQEVEMHDYADDTDNKLNPAGKLRFDDEEKENIQVNIQGPSNRKRKASTSSSQHAFRSASLRASRVFSSNTGKKRSIANRASTLTNLSQIKKTRSVRSEKRQKRGGKVSRKKGGTLPPLPPIPIIDALSILHHFDRFHDFGVKFTQLNDDNGSMVINAELQNIYNSFKHSQESAIVNQLLSKVVTDKGQPLDDIIINIKIYFEDHMEVVRKDEIIKKEVNKVISQYVFKNDGDTRDNNYLEDIGLTTVPSWKTFQKSILKKIAHSVEPFEKTWDPHGKQESEFAVDFCKQDTVSASVSRVHSIYNEHKQAGNDQNHYAFREFTKKHFNISFECDGFQYKGIKLKLVKANDEYFTKLQNQYANLVAFINGKTDASKPPMLSFNNRERAIIMYSSGFSIQNIKDVIQKLKEFINIQRKKDADENLVIDINSLLLKGKMSDSNKYDYKKYLILLLISVTYLANTCKLDIKDISAILYDLKKSGDWGQALYCKKYNTLNVGRKRACFISGDILAAFYSILNDVPTILSGEKQDKPSEKKHDQIRIYIGNSDLDINYIKNIVQIFVKNNVFSLMQSIAVNDSEYMQEVNNIIKRLGDVEKHIHKQDENLPININVNTNPAIFFNIILVADNNNILSSLMDIIKDNVFIPVLNIFKNYIIKQRREFNGLDVVMENLPHSIISSFEIKRLEMQNKYESMIRQQHGNSKKANAIYVKACYEGVTLFKKHLELFCDALYLIYVFFIDRSIYTALNNFATNILKYMAVPKHFLKDDNRYASPPRNKKGNFLQMSSANNNYLKDVLLSEIQTTVAQNGRKSKSKSKKDDDGEADIREKIKVQFQGKLKNMYSLLLKDMIDILSCIKFNIIDNIRQKEFWNIFKPMFEFIYIDMKNAVNADIDDTYKEIQAYRLTEDELDAINILFVEIKELAQKPGIHFPIITKYATFVKKSILSLEQDLLNDTNIKEFLKRRTYNERARLLIIRYNKFKEGKQPDDILRLLRSSKSTKEVKKIKNIVTSLQMLPFDYISTDRGIQLESIYNELNIKNVYNASDDDTKHLSIYDVFPLQDLQYIKEQIEIIFDLVKTDW